MRTPESALHTYFVDEGSHVGQSGGGLLEDVQVAGGEYDEPLLPPGEQLLLLDPHHPLPEAGVVTQQTGGVVLSVGDGGGPGGER